MMQSHNEVDSTNNPNTSSSLVDLFRGNGEMATLMRSTDWSKTKLGPSHTWPKSLKTMLGVVLGSRFPMLLWWGPELLHLYNDAYRPILRDKHPASLAAPAAIVWAEVWDVAGPMARSVQEGGPATWTEDLQLFINSAGMAEETYFTFSYSPVPGDDGQVGGLLNTVQETTAKVQSERQIRMLHDLAARTAEAKSENEAYRIALEVLSGNALDLPFVLLYTLNDKSDEATLTATSDWKDYNGPAKSDRFSVVVSSTSDWPLAEAFQTSHKVIVDNLSARFGTLPADRWNARPEQAIILPLCRTSQSTPYAFLIGGISPHRKFDERYRQFFQATATQVANVIANARAYETETKRAETLAELDRAKTTFFSNVSHEFRTPLTLILGPIEDALSNPNQSLEGENLLAVHRSTIRLLRLVNSLLDFARIESSRLQMVFVPTNLSSLTMDLASSFRSLIERAGLTFTVNCPPIAEPIYVDPAQWEKIVLNLLSNAFKFTFKGEIALTLHAYKDHIELTVRDTGSGIPTHELAQIFERFHRVEGAKGRSFEGTGIGLSLVQELVKLHGGTVCVSSIEGQGSTFSVSIPTGFAHLPAERVFNNTATLPTPTSTTPYLLEASQWLNSTTSTPTDTAVEDSSLPIQLTKLPNREHARVLIVDDNTDMRDYLSRILSTRWHVEVAEDGQVALESIRNQPPDLVLTDVMMPRLDGVALLSELRKHEQTNQIPVVLLSARAGEDAILEGLETGADDYLVKPFSARELLARVQTHLELARLRRQWSHELERANHELETFSYSVSHDLRAPLRAIDGFSKALLSDYANSLDEQGKHYLTRVRAATQRMSQLIDDLLSLSRITRATLQRESVNMTEVAFKILNELEGRDPERNVQYQVSNDLIVHADPHLLRIMLENLLGNAWKFTSNQTDPAIQVGKEEQANETVFFIRDNGAGFDMKYANKLFSPFQRLHSETQFEGTGIGLATVHRIVTRHGGRVWAKSAPNDGATFFFTLGESHDH